jgi:hypothetical protein
MALTVIRGHDEPLKHARALECRISSNVLLDSGFWRVTVVG